MVYTPSGQAALDDVTMGYYNKFAFQVLLPDVYRRHYPAPLPLPLTNDNADIHAMLNNVINTMLDNPDAIMEGELGSFSGPCPALPRFGDEPETECTPTIHEGSATTETADKKKVMAEATKKKKVAANDKPAADDKKKAAAKVAENIAIEEVKKSIAGLSMSLQQAAVGRPFLVSMKRRNGTAIIKLKDGSSYDGPLKFLDGYDQTNAALFNLKSDPHKYCTKNRELYLGKLIFVDEVKHVRTVDDKLVPWNLTSISWHCDPKSQLPYVVLVIHCSTLEEHRGLDGLHTAQAHLLDGTMQAHMWGWENVSVEPSNYFNTMHMDYFAFAFEKDESPTSILSEADLEFVIESWTRNVLQKLHDLEGVKIAFLFAATESLFSKRIFSVSKQIQAYHQKRRQIHLGVPKQACHGPSCLVPVLQGLF